LQEREFQRKYNTPTSINTTPTSATIAAPKGTLEFDFVPEGERVFLIWSFTLRSEVDIKVERQLGDWQNKYGMG